MNLNMFRVLTPAEHAALEQLRDREQWELSCRELGATPAQIAAYEADAQRYAQTTLYPNARIVAEARRAAREALLRGQPMPTSAAAALEAAWARELVQLLGIHTAE